jgi:hypothetical protein
MPKILMVHPILYIPNALSLSIKLSNYKSDLLLSPNVAANNPYGFNPSLQVFME